MVPNRLSVNRSTEQLTLPAEEVNGFELPDEWLAELLDPAVWSPVLETYADTTRLAVALTDTQGRMLGDCHNPQAFWSMVKGETGDLQGACSFCLAPPSPCNAVEDALESGGVVMVTDGACLAHVAVPLSLGGRSLGTLIAGQVFSRYPEPLPLQRVARDSGVSAQQVWHEATRQVPVTRAALEIFAHLLMSLGNAFLGQQYAAILQRNLAATNLRYRLLIDGVQDYALFTLDDSGNIVGWNSGAERMFGYTGTEILGRGSACLHTPEEGLRNEAIIQSLKQADRLGWVESEGWRLRKDNGRFYATGVLASLGQGAAREYGVLIRDITELRKSREATRQAQRLESIGNLAAGVAHDFNNLLTGIMGSVALAKTSLPPGHSAYPLLEIAEHSSERAAELTAQLLAYAGKGKFVISHFDLSALITEMRPMIEGSVPKGIQLQFVLTPLLPWIEGDAGQIRQMVMNVIANASEAISGGGGTVRVSAGVLDPGGEVYLEVKDSGSGMTEVTRAKMFDPFFSTKFVGRGLGLAAVAGILRGHKGRTEVESTPGEGTTFRVLFPAFEPIAPSGLESPSTVVARGTGILFVDDEPSLRRLGKLTLERAGYAVLLARDGLEAVDIFSQNTGRIGTVFLDMTMPVMGGLQALQLIREIQPAVHVILMTGFTEEAARGDIDPSVVTGFLQKPYTIAELVASMRARVENAQRM